MKKEIPMNKTNQWECCGQCRVFAKNVGSTASVIFECANPNCICHDVTCRIPESANSLEKLLEEFDKKFNLALQGSHTSDGTYLGKVIKSFITTAFEAGKDNVRRSKELKQVIDEAVEEERNRIVGVIKTMYQTDETQMNDDHVYDGALDDVLVAINKE